MISAQLPPGAAEGQMRSVCVVDDDPAVLDSAALLLGALGYETVGHASAGALLADDRRLQFGCLIVDHHMPGMTGLEMLATLRREGSTVPAILVTGRLDPDIFARAQMLGVEAILEKPFAGARLVELVRAHLERGG